MHIIGDYVTSGVTKSKAPMIPILENGKAICRVKRLLNLKIMNFMVWLSIRVHSLSAKRNTLPEY